MLKVRDIMTQELYTVSAASPIDEAAWGLHGRGIGGAPVCDQRGRVVGIVTMTDLSDPDRTGGDPTAPVADVMTRTVLGVRADDPALLAVRRMVFGGVHRLLVVNGDGQVVGIVTTTDVLAALDRGEEFGVLDECWSPEGEYVEVHTSSPMR